VASEDGAPVRVERALLSVDDKSGIADLARALVELRVELWATGGTRRTITDAGVLVGAAEDLTGVSAWFGGRVKTLHPALLGGILAPRTEDGLRELQERGLRPFDLVVTNLYPFERHLTEHPNATDREEFIDIGGVTLARAGAKNHTWVTVVTDPADYPSLVTELRTNGGAVSAATRLRLAQKAFALTTAYDGAIARALGPPGPGSEPFPDEVTFRREPLKLRYGENPHQRAATYRMVTPGVAGAEPRPFTVIKGDALSYTNLLDVDTAVSIVAEFPGPSAAVVKHATPCGVASGASIREAIERAIATDPVARYGCAVAVNRPLVADDLGALKGVFVDLLVAPEFDPGTREPLEHRPKVKVVRTEPPSLTVPGWEAKSALGRLLLQDQDHRELAPGDFRCVTTKTASPETACALDFAWRVVRHAKSNAIVLAQGARTVGIGTGQPTRVKAVELACEVAGERARGAVLASDAFFPFPDGIEVAGRAGVSAVIQPGGSLRDPEVIAAAERYGIAMYFTGWRVFRH
jgi:phosphoribosylaminoimidazolecarboxamide formyltransferase/IMP cyclohydrolase